MPTLRRVNYFAGRLLSADDFRAEQEYHREKSRLHNRRLHGSGVASGLTVSLAGGSSRPVIAVKPGVGIDPAGNELELVLVPDDPPRRRDDSGLALARYVRSGSAWQRDRAFKVGRVRAGR